MRCLCRCPWMCWIWFCFPKKLGHVWNQKNRFNETRSNRPSENCMQKNCWTCVNVWNVQEPQKFCTMFKLCITFQLQNLWSCSTSITSTALINGFRSRPNHGLDMAGSQVQIVRKSFTCHKHLRKPATYPLVNKHSYGKWPFIVDFPIENGDFL